MIDVSKLKVTLPDNTTLVKPISQDDLVDRKVSFKIKSSEVGYQTIEVSYDSGPIHKTEILVNPEVPIHFIFNKIGETQEHKEAGVGVVGGGCTAQFKRGPVDPGDALKWGGVTALLYVKFTCEYMKLLPDGTYYFNCWIPGVSFVVRWIDVTIKNDPPISVEQYQKMING